MATYVNDLRLKEIATGDESGTWGTSTNTNLELIAEAFSYGTEAITTNADTHTTTIADGSTDPGRSIYLKYTGTLDSACTITIGPNTVSKLWFIENATSGSQNIIISQGSGANITIPAGDTKAVYSDGAGSGAAMVDAFASLSVVDLKVQDDLTVTDDASVGGDLLVSGEVQTANIGFTDGDNAITIADGGGITAAAGITSTAASNTFGATSFNDADITNVGSIALDTITNDGTDITIDSGGDIILDADGTDIILKDGGTEFSRLMTDSTPNHFYLKSSISDADMIFQGNDGGSTITALTLDMSDAGQATFNSGITFGGGLTTASGTNINIFSGDASASSVINLGTSAATRLHVDNDGNIGINTTSPTKLALSGGTGKVLHMDGDDSQVRLQNGLFHHDNSGNTITHLRNNYGATSAAAELALESGFITFNTGTSFTERARFTGDGNLLIGSSFTSAVNSCVLQAAGNSISGGVVGFYDPDVSVATSNVILQLTWTVDQDATGGKYAQFSDGNTNCGSISAASGTAVAFNTTSDERLKKNIVDASPQLNVIKDIKVREFDWKQNNHHEVGMIAQELHKVIPNVVTVGDDEHEMNWGVDYGKLTPYLIKAVQELSATVDELKTEIQTLKGE